MTAEDQFDMLFGPGEKKEEVQDPAIMLDDAIIAVNEGKDPALVEESKPEPDEAVVDDAIVFEDDAIV